MFGKTNEGVTAREQGSDNIEVVKIGDGSLWHHRRSFIICSIVCLSTTQYGMDYGLIGGLQAMPGFLAVFGFADPMLPGGYGIDPTVQQLINSLMTAGAFIGSLSVGPLSKFLSRRYQLLLACVLNHVGAILMLASTQFGALYASRVVIGLANGLFMVNTQIYIQECAVPKFRGPLLGIYQVVLALGAILGSIVDNYTSTRLDRSSYQIPCGCLFIIPTILLIVLPFLPESPRWLLDHDRHDEARHALTRLRPSSEDSHLIDAEFNEMVQSFHIERSMNQSVQVVDMFKGTNRRRTLLSMGLVLSLSATGNLFLIVYGTYFFSIAGESAPFAESVGMNCAGLAGVLLSLYIITIVGRRTILLTGAATQAFCMLVMGAVYVANPTSTTALKCVVAFTILHIFFYTGCTASYLYLAAGEMPSNTLRSFTLGSANSLGFLGAWVISFTVPYFLNPLDLNWGPKYAFIWFGSNIAYFLFIFFFVPETKDRTLEEIDEMFQNKVSAWGFKKYVCVGANEARLEGLHNQTEKEGVTERIEMVQ